MFISTKLCTMMEISFSSIFLLLFYPLGNKAQSVKPSFSWIDQRHIRVNLDGTNEDIIALFPTKYPVPCLYEGILKYDASGSVAVSGCRNDDIVHIVIYSHWLPQQHMFDLKNGSTEQVELIYGGETEESEQERIKRETIEDYEDYVEEYYFDVGYDGLPEVPPMLVLNVKLAYEETLLDYLGSHEAARQYLLKVFTLGRIHFQHSSLGTQIWLKLTEPVKYIPNQRWKPTRAGIKNATLFKDRDRIPTTFFCFTDDTNYFMGLAYTRFACDLSKGVAITKWRSNVQLAAQTYVHENGHLLGGQHDEVEDRKNRKNGSGEGPCTGTGMMTTQRQENGSGWSNCTRERFHGVCQVFRCQDL